MLADAGIRQAEYRGAPATTWWNVSNVVPLRHHDARDDGHAM